MKTNWQEDYRKLWLKNPSKIKDIELFIENLLLSRDQALLEAFKKDVGEMKKDEKEIHNETRWSNQTYNSALNNLLSLLKDYNLKI